MANTSAKVLTDSFSEILAYAQGSGSVNFYMAHGGTNFGWTAGQLFGGYCVSLYSHLCRNDANMQTRMPGSCKHAGKNPCNPQPAKRYISAPVSGLVKNAEVKYTLQWL